MFGNSFTKATFNFLGAEIWLIRCLISNVAWTCKIKMINIIIYVAETILFCIAKGS